MQNHRPQSTSRSSKLTRSPPIPHPVRRPRQSLQKLPSVSAPVSFQRLLQIKFQSPTGPTQPDHKQSVALKSSEGTSFDTESNSDYSNSVPEGNTASTSQSSCPSPSQLALALGTALTQKYPISELAHDPSTRVRCDSEGSLINTQKEASIRLAAAGARKKVIRAEHRLKLYIAQEHTILGQLYQELAEQAGRQATAADMGMNHVRNAIQSRGFQALPTSLTPSAQSSVSVRKRRLSS